MARYSFNYLAILFISFFVYSLSGCGGVVSLQSIGIHPSVSNLAKGRTQQFTAIGHYSNGSTKDITSSVTWDSSNPTIAIINAATGLASTLDYGTSTITATDFNSSIAATATLAVDVIEVMALYPNNGANWNDYVFGDDITNATDMACDANNDIACINGGLIRTFEVPGVMSCTNLTAKDDLNIFNWICDESTDPVSMISTGFKNDSSFINLIDSNVSSWLHKYVIIYDSGVPVFTTANTQWWDNPIVTDNDGGYLSEAGTIYTVTASNNNNYIINASSVGLIVSPVVVLNGTGAGGNVVMANGRSIARDFLWMEGAVDATGDGIGIYFRSIRHSVLRNITANGAKGTALKKGIYLQTSSCNKLTNITVNDNYSGVHIRGSSNNTLVDITASKNSWAGVWLQSASNNTLVGITASNNDMYGIILDVSSNNTLVDVTANNNNWIGVWLDYSWSNTLKHLSAGSNSSIGLRLDSVLDSNTLVDITSSNNQTGIRLDNNSSSYFSGYLKVGNNSTIDCYVSAVAALGLVHSTCANNGSSDATLIKGVSTLSSFVDPGAGDYALLISDTVLLNVLALPTGDDTLMHEWSDSSTTVLLRRAVEIQGDGIGNENTLCESHEHCLYTPNIAAYQGHGDLISAGSFINGSLTGITLWKYDTNGY